MDHFLFEFGIRALLVAAGTAVVLRVTNIRTASARHLAWSGVLVFMMLLPLWTVWGPRLSWKVLPASVLVSSADKDITARAPVPVSDGATGSGLGTVFSRDESRPWEMRHLLTGIYVVVASVLLLRLALGTVRAHLLIRRATVSDGVLTSAACAAPITVGWFRPVAILPEEWRQWPQNQLDAVLTHEREHARRRDPLVQWLALLNRALFWFHPLAWWIERHLSALAEEACDAAVLARGHDPQDYSEYLLRMADSVMQAGRRVGFVGMGMPGSFLSRRIPRLFDARIALRISRTRLTCSIAACAISSVAFAASALEPREVRLEPLSPQPIAPAPIKAQPPRRAVVVQTAVPAPLPVQVAAPASIEIDARIVTANKSFAREFGSQIGLQVGMPGQANSGLVFLMQPGSDVEINRILAAAEAGGNARVTSHPKVTTLNDVTANITQGTQIPVQTNVNGMTSVNFMTFALKLDVTPHVVAAGIIMMKLSVEDSQPDFSRAVNGVPSVRTQMMKSEVLMKEGSTLMIGGIYVGPQDIRQVPGLGAIPIIGNLFTKTQQDTAELLFFITPRIKASQP
jgi:hypothetical protein